MLSDQDRALIEATLPDDHEAAIEQDIFTTDEVVKLVQAAREEGRQSAGDRVGLLERALRQISDDYRVNHTSKWCKYIADSALAPQAAPVEQGEGVPKGFVLVPREITEEMLVAAWREDLIGAGGGENDVAMGVARRMSDTDEIRDARRTYRAMIAAAPSPTEGV